MPLTSQPAAASADSCETLTPNSFDQVSKNKPSAWRGATPMSDMKNMAATTYQP